MVRPLFLVVRPGAPSSFVFLPKWNASLKRPLMRLDMCVQETFWGPIGCQEFVVVFGKVSALNDAFADRLASATAQKICDGLQPTSDGPTYCSS